MMAALREWLRVLFSSPSRWVPKPMVERAPRHFVKLLAPAEALREDAKFQDDKADKLIRDANELRIEADILEDRAHTLRIAAAKNRNAADSINPEVKSQRN